MLPNKLLCYLISCYEEDLDKIKNNPANEHGADKLLGFAFLP